eukprot:SAG31_NODE_5332_length_2603_cov_2.775958_3_plen_89_part_00
MDEVDAALDEINQNRLARVLSQVLGGNAGCQTITISHHVDFQRSASRIVNVVKEMGADGSSLSSKVLCVCSIPLSFANHCECVFVHVP